MAKHIWWPLLSPYHLAIYHDPGSLSSYAGGLAIDLALVSLFFGLFLAILKQRGLEESGPLWVILPAFCVTRAIAFAAFFVNIHAEVLWTQTTQLVFFCATSVACLLISVFSPSVFQASTRAARFGLAICGCCILWMLPDLIITAVVTRVSGTEVNAFNRPVRRPVAEERVIWILMDELSYDQVYEHRQPDVHLPHFEELKNESVVFSDVEPEGYLTERIVPALFLGRKLDGIRSSLQKTLEVHDLADSRWEPFDGQASIFGEAQRLGWTTGVAGWYNPYCHILKDVLDSCYWQSSDSALPHFSGGRFYLLSAAAFPLESRFSSHDAPEDTRLQAHVKDYREITAAADALIRNVSIGFVFLHLPVPHPPGIYSRKTGTLGVPGSYLDNLVLADKLVGQFLTTIQDTGAAASRTIVVISSDHSWRVPMWRDDSSWSAEDEHASGGRFDPRPFLLIRFPGEKSDETRTEPFPEIEIHGILEAMLKSEVLSPEELDKWLETHRAASSRVVAVNGQ